MSITKDDLYKIIEKLSDSDTASAFDYLHYLLTRSKPAKNKTWAQITELSPDNEPLNDEELRQLAAPEDYISIDQATEEYDI